MKKHSILICALVFAGLSSACSVDWINWSNNRIKLGEYQAADKTLLRYLDETKDDKHSRKKEAFFLLGLSQLFSRKFDTAQQYFQTAINEDPSFHRAVFFKGVVFSVNGEKKKALESFEAALKILEEKDGVPDDGYGVREKEKIIISCYVMMAAFSINEKETALNFANIIKDRLKNDERALFWSRLVIANLSDQDTVILLTAWMPKQRNLLTSSIGNSISYFFEIKLPKAAIDSDNSAEIFEQWTQSNLVESIARIN